MPASSLANATGSLPNLKRLLGHGGLIVILLVVIVLAMMVIEPRFFNRLNLFNISNVFAYLTIIALGQMLVMIAGGFDLSVGTVMALSSVVAATAMANLADGNPDSTFTTIAVGVAVALASGTAVGLANGFSVAVLGINPLIATLAMTSILTGGILYYTQGIPVYGIPDPFIATVGGGRALGMPVAFWVAVAIAAIIIFAQRFMPFGRHVYAIGGNPQAARLSNLPITRLRLVVYGISGFLASVTGLLLTGLVGSGQSSIGSTSTIECISAAVIGGVSLRGGAGRAERVVLAALFLTVLANALDLARVDSKYQTLVLGTVLILALPWKRCLAKGAPMSKPVAESSILEHWVKYRQGLRALSSINAVAILIPILLLVFGYFEPRVLTLGNGWNIAIQASYMALFVAAQCVVMLTRGFDLSLGTSVSLISVLSAIAMVNAAPWGDLPAIIFGFAVGIGTGALIGAFNGFFVAVIGINPFVVTLGTLNILLSFGTTISDGFPISGLPQPFSDVLTGYGPFHVPMIVWVTLVTLLCLHLTLKHTVFGRSLYQIGSNPRAAIVAGIATRFHLVSAYVLCSVIIALGTLMLTARTGSGEPNLGGNLALSTIAAGVIGGISLRGGEGTIAAPIIGALFVTVLSNGMNLMRIDGYLQDVALGIVIIAGLFFDRRRIQN